MVIVMRKKYERPYGAVYVGFIVLAMLFGILYRYDIVFNNSVILYTWLLLFVIGIIILFWGMILHITYRMPRHKKIRTDWTK